jgi:hypothetical protein
MTSPTPRPLKLPRSPLASLPGWDIAERIVAEQHNTALLQLDRQRDQWRDTVEPRPRRFAEPREIGKPPVDPDAEQLAGEVGGLADELQRGCG